MDFMDAFSGIDWNQRLDAKIDKAIKEVKQLSEKTWYTSADLDTKVNSDETLREYIRDTEKEFGKSKADVDNMSNAELNEYISGLDSLW